ncbi:MAG: M1 family metallopeptidase [Bacteroidia bacterium]|nr:M1 family metallopeptidase [Bacteroidia bacterium]MDW8088209.1 M1 family metallopeptidase [Bacteroidia bacterium]
MLLWAWGLALAQPAEVLGYDLWLDSLSLPDRFWQWRGGVIFRPNTATRLSLRLSGYQIDSVVWRHRRLSFRHQDSLLEISLINSGQTPETLYVFYHGSGVQDPRGFGGVLWGNTYVFNIGVSLNLIPHSFGRAWHPCVDSFGHKATYAFHLRVPTGLVATANGLLDSISPAGPGWQWWHWRMDRPIPAYTAGVAIGPYAAVRDTLVRQPGDSLPIVYWIPPDQAGQVASSFARLKNVLANWESRFGRFPYAKVGYVATPFASGAMEHATNIVYPALALDGTSRYDWLWAHELAHEWFGNAVTGGLESQIFLKEGFASYAEALYYEQFEGPSRYAAYIQGFLEPTLRLLKWEEGLFPIASTPPEHTYGIATYRKGPTVVHTLRYQMGDELFFQGLRAYYARYQHRTVTLDSLRMALENATGLSLEAFFADWLGQPGEVHFRLDSFGVAEGDSVWLAWRILLRDKPSYRTPTRLAVLLRRGNQEIRTSFFTDGTLRGRTKVFCPFLPEYVVLNPNGEVAEATTHATVWVRANRNTSAPATYLTLRATGLAPEDSVWVHVALGWVGAPDRGNSSLSPSRYHRLEGRWDKTIALRGTFTYNGSDVGTGAYLDYPWLNFSEDSLALYWRPRAGEPWQEWPSYTVDPGNDVRDGRGRILADSLLPGEYALGPKGALPTTLPALLTPAGPLWTVVAEAGVLHLHNHSEEKGRFAVYDLLGRKYGEGEAQPGEKVTFSLMPGLYLVQTPAGTYRQLVWP